MPPLRSKPRASAVQRGRTPHTLTSRTSRPVIIAKVARYRRLSRPPIKEALIDVRVASDPAIEVDRLRGLHGSLAAEYPNIDEKRQFKAELRVEAGKVLPPSTEELGFAALVFSNADKTRIAQLRRDGFTVNQLGGYTTADALIGDAVRLRNSMSSS